jgi:hypothetical protein
MSRRGPAVPLIGAAVGLLRSVAGAYGRLPGDLGLVVEDVFGPLIELAR